jgi:hypothetical protein
MRGYRLAMSEKFVPAETLSTFQLAYIMDADVAYHCFSLID